MVSRDPDRVDIEAYRNANVSYSDVDAMPDVTGPQVGPILDLLEVLRRVFGLFA